MLALRALVPAGGTIAYPSYACIDLTTAALGANVRVRLYDIDPVTLSPDLDSLRAAVARGVDAILHAGDITGREVIRALLQACDEKPNITFLPDSAGIDLVMDKAAPPSSRPILGAAAPAGCSWPPETNPRRR